ncbi:hypothetical protein ZIOFF_005851 [Zingiber officinale]|uniref:Protein kinase domain-containing protein n=1 Tax=Zingiber officinale TaxID=94328 RepID=A0A8J5HRE0_ZINOF|nr:hypothetical protein ZIOFF_005851 [Zingiber officinale]
MVSPGSETWCFAWPELRAWWDAPSQPTNLDEKKRSPIEGVSVLGYRTRYSSALDLPSALLYLHKEAEQCVVNKDVKSSSMMLDSYFNATKGDFGLVKLVDHEFGLKNIAVARTFGYLALECFATDKASKELDMFNFSVVALEITAGRRAMETSKDDEEVRLVDWVWSMHDKVVLLEAVDRSLDEIF